MSIREDAEKNLRMAGFFDKDSDYDGMLGEAVMKLVNCHLDEGHSGASHEIALWLFNKVINNQALTKRFYELRKSEMEKFAHENMGEPWKKEILDEMLGPIPQRD